jgi:erythromycin esterase
MLRFLFLIMCTYLSLGIIPSKGQLNDPKFNAIKNNSLKVITIDSDHDDFSDLMPLKGTLKDVDVIALGEPNHFSGATFEMKVRMIKFLQAELGFNAIAFESGIYSCAKGNALIASQKDHNNYLSQSIFGVWDTKEVKKLSDFINKNQGGDRPFQLSGFDTQFSGTIPSKYFIADFKEILIKWELGELMRDSTWHEYESALEKLIKYSNYLKKPSVQDTVLLISKTYKIISIINQRQFYSTSELELKESWINYCNNIIFETRRKFKGRSYRDKKMAENLMWLLSHKFKGQKVILWGASSHFAYNHTLVKHKNWENNIPMGEYLKQNISDRYYSIGFTSYDGILGKIIFPIKLKKPNTHSLEGLFNRTEEKYLFLNLRNKDVKSALGPYIEARPFGYKSIFMSITEVMDGIFYLKTTYPATWNTLVK